MFNETMVKRTNHRQVNDVVGDNDNASKIMPSSNYSKSSDNSHRRSHKRRRREGEDDDGNSNKNNDDGDDNEIKRNKQENSNRHNKKNLHHHTINSDDTGKDGSQHSTSSSPSSASADDNSFSTASSSDDDYNRRHRDRDHKKHRKDKHSSNKKEHKHKSKRIKKEEKKKKKKKDKKRRHEKKDRKSTKKLDNYESNSSAKSDELHELSLERNYNLADALCNLLEYDPNFATELPIILIRLGRGTSLDLRQMTNTIIAQRLQQIFVCLSSFGVSSSSSSSSDNNNMVWSWNNPTSNTSSRSNNNSSGSSDLVLIRVVRALLDQIGITMDAIHQYENPIIDKKKISNDSDYTPASFSDEPKTSLLNEIEAMTMNLLNSFRDGNLATELAEICTMIIDGEAINLDGLPDMKIKDALESLLLVCGLEKTEMDIDSSSTDNEDGTDDNEENNGDHEPPFGYGLPETNSNLSKEKLMNIIHICHSQDQQTKVDASGAAVNKRPVIKGPMLPNQYQNESSDDDDDGPLPMGAAAANRALTLSKEQVKAAAARRAYEMACAKEGIDIDPNTSMNSVREEWMVVPGKYDFLSSIQTGRSRTFSGKCKSSSSSKGHVSNAEMDQKIHQEIQAIRESYEATRGPSLMDQHHEARKREQEEKQLLSSSVSSSWKWNRDTDLDAGRRVDKDALGMILGNASTDLKNKFQSGR